MIIGGLQKFSLLDYPDRIAAIIFTQGCNFRCPFCYNPMLVGPYAEVGKIKNTLDESQEEKDHHLISEGDLFRFLENRLGKLEGVVITGGEPTVHKDLGEFIKKIKNLGYLIKLDTNGTNPEIMQELIKQKLIDYIAMDIKSSPKQYDKASGVKINFSKIQESVIIIKNSGLPYEFRTTVVPRLIEKQDLKKMGEIIKGADKWYLQKFKPNFELVDKDFEDVGAFTDKEMEEMREIGAKYVKRCEVR